MNNFSRDAEELLNKIKNKEDLSREDWFNLFYEYEIHTEEGEEGRWSRYMTTISKLNNTYIVTYWSKGLTEYQENEYDDYPIIVESIDTETITMYKHKFNLKDGTSFSIINDKYELGS